MLWSYFLPEVTRLEACYRLILWGTGFGDIQTWRVGGGGLNMAWALSALKKEQGRVQHFCDFS